VSLTASGTGAHPSDSIPQYGNAIDQVTVRCEAHPFVSPTLPVFGIPTAYSLPVHSLILSEKNYFEL
jgi:hypothetical protein